MNNKIDETIDALCDAIIKNSERIEAASEIKQLAEAVQVLVTSKSVENVGTNYLEALKGGF